MRKNTVFFFFFFRLCLVAQLCPILCDPMDCSLPDSSDHGDSPGKNTGVGCHARLQGIFPTQGSNPDLPHSRQSLYYLSDQGSPFFFFFFKVVNCYIKSFDLKYEHKFKAISKIEEYCRISKICSPKSISCWSIL